MTIWITATSVYLLLTAAALSLLRAAALGDRMTATDLSGRSCPMCSAADVYVDCDGVCLCITCCASYPLTTWQEAL